MFYPYSKYTYVVCLYCVYARQIISHHMTRFASSETRKPFLFSLFSSCSLNLFPCLCPSAWQSAYTLIYFCNINDVDAYVNVNGSENSKSNKAEKYTHTHTHTKTTHSQLMSDYHQVDVTFSSSPLAGKNGRLESQIKTLAKGEGKQISRDTAGDIDWNSDTATTSCCQLDGYMRLSSIRRIGRKPKRNPQATLKA